MQKRTCKNRLLATPKQNKSIIRWKRRIVQFPYGRSFAFRFLFFAFCLFRFEQTVRDRVNAEPNRTMQPEEPDATDPHGGDESHNNDGTGGGESYGDRSRSRYDTIRTELRFLSDLHRMRERGGFGAAAAGGEEENNNNSGNSTTGGTARRGPGRTRTLKPRHLNDFSDEDYPAYTKGDRERYPGDATDATYRRFRIFNRFARSTCHAKAIPRKEIFEAWAMALYVHETFLSHRALSLSLPPAAAAAASSSSASGSSAPGRNQRQRRRRRSPIKRFADLACSHGLLSWALLLLASSEEEEEKSERQPGEQQQQCHEGKGSGTTPPRKKLMSAVCIDIAMPKSSETLSKIFFAEYPQFRDDGSAAGTRTSTSTDAGAQSTPTQSGTQKQQQQQHQQNPRWDYVEGPVENLVAHESTLLMGIHACGRLSDTIIDKAIDSNAPLALVPCCHSKKILTASQAEGFAALLASSSSSSSSSSNCKATAAAQQQQQQQQQQPPIPSYTLADFMDSIRKQRLVEAGYAVEEIWIPEEFTPKNRILLAVPPAVPSDGPHPSPFSGAKKKPFGIPYFAIPLEDAPPARAALRSVAGRASANRRKDAANPPPAICVSVWLPTSSSSSSGGGGGASAGGKNDEENKNDDVNNGAVFSVEALQKVLEATTTATVSGGGRRSPPGPTVRVVEAEHKPYVDPNDSSRRSKTVRVHYLDCRNNKAEARKRHKMLKEVLIPRHFPAYTIRD